MVLNDLCQNEILLHDPSRSCWYHFRRPSQVLTTMRVEEVLAVFHELDRALALGEWYTAGFVSYEAAPGLDPALKTRASSGFPLVWFGLYPAPEVIPSDQLFEAAPTLPAYARWRPSVEREMYDAAIGKIKDYIARGDTYQVNYTYRLAAPFAGDPLAFFLQIATAQRAPYAAFVHLGRYCLLSASPELFFDLDGEIIRSKPMKGTARRGLTYAEDEEQSTWLHHSEKNRAENVMIVDMVRNDIGRIARTGSVQVPELFSVEKYPTVLQMVSTVTGKTIAPQSEIFKALFPPASITGAPKARTMEIIRELETTPRRIYTGCIGFIGPGRKTQFNVAIRTVLLDREEQRAEYGVGGGITWDSVDSAEYEECLTKAKILTFRLPQFSLLETLLWSPAEGYFLLKHHLDRLGKSAAYFGYRFEAEQVKGCLEAASRSFEPEAHKVRLLLSECGEPAVQAESLPQNPKMEPLQVCLAPSPVDASDPLLYHKTTHRQIYAQARAACHEAYGEGWDDVLLWNENGELTESTVANLLVELGGRLYTPPVHCGLLAGTYRAWLLEQGLVEERVLPLEVLSARPAVFLVNSVRKMQAAAITRPGWLKK